MTKENCLNCDKFPVCRVVDKIIFKVRVKGGWVDEVDPILDKAAKICDYFVPKKINQ